MKTTFSYHDPLTKRTLEVTPGNTGVLIDISLADGHHANVDVPAAQIVKLLAALLAMPPVERLGAGKPAVLWFPTDDDRMQFMAAVQEAMPHLKAHKL